MTVTIHKHGGVHEWDISAPEMREALYVGNRHCPKFIDLLTSLVVQYHNHRICASYALYKSGNITPVPTCLLGVSQKRLGLGHSYIYRCSRPILCCYFLRQDLAVRPKSTNLG